MERGTVLPRACASPGSALSVLCYLRDDPHDACRVRGLGRAFLYDRPIYLSIYLSV